MDEIGRMVIRLLGDAAGYTNMLKSSEESTQKTTKNIESSFDKASKNVKSGFGSMAKNIMGFAKALLPIGAVIGAALGAKAIMDATEEQFVAEKKLQAVLKATGGAAKLTAKEIGEYAGELQKTTNFGDEAVVGASALLATFKNVKGDQFKGALKAGADLASVFDMDIKSSVRMVGRALEDPGRGMMFLRRQGIMFTKEQQEQIKNMQAQGNLVGAQTMILDKIKSSYGGAAEAMARPQKQFLGLLGDVGETIGNALLPSIDRIYRSLIKIIRPIADAGDQSKVLGQQIFNIVDMGLDLFDQFGASMFAWVGQAIGWFTDWFIMVEFGYRNWDKVASLTLTNITLYAVRFFNQFVHFFQEVVPSLLNWMRENWTDVWFTAVDYTLTILENLGKNIRQIFSNVVKIIKGELEFGDIFKGVEKDLTKGAFNAIKKLPDIPERIVGGLEAELARVSADKTAKLTEGFTSFFENRKKELAQFQASQGVTPIAGGPGGTGMTAKDEAKGVDFDLTELQKKALQVQAGQRSGPQEETAKNTKELLRQQQQANLYLQELLTVNHGQLDSMEAESEELDF